MKLSTSKLRQLAREEKSSSRMYRKIGLFKYAKDEARHARNLEKLAGKAK